MSTPLLYRARKWIWLAMAIPALLGFARLRFDVEVLNLLPNHLSSVQGLKVYQSHMANSRELILTLKCADPEATREAAEKLAAALRAKHDLVQGVAWQPPWQEHPEQVAELLGYLWLNQPTNSFADFYARLQPAQISRSLSEARELLTTSMSPEIIGRAGYDPLGLIPSEAALGTPATSLNPFSPGAPFSNQEGTFRALFVQSRVNLETYEDCERWLNAVKAITAETLQRSHPNVIPAYTGRPAFVSEIARGMQRDISSSVIGTAAIIAVIFWVAHRKWKPLLWLMAFLGIILLGALGIGGFVFGTINVISVGFAAILLGLTVDYALVHYQEGVARPEMCVREIQNAISPGVAWAAITTITAFLLLNAGGLPGLAQLGTLVAIGVALGAAIITLEYLPALFPERRFGRPTSARPPATEPNAMTRSQPDAWSIPVSGTLLAVCLLVLSQGLPGLDPTGNALRPRGSPSYAALDEFQRSMVQDREPVGVVMTAKNEAALREKVLQTRTALEQMQKQGLIKEYTLPLALLPDPTALANNGSVARKLEITQEDLIRIAGQEGFSPQAVQLAGQMLDFFKAPHYPTNELSSWVISKVYARTSTNAVATGLVKTFDKTSEDTFARVQQALPPETWLSSWGLLGQSVFGMVKERFWLVVIPMVLLVVLSLVAAFRRPHEVLLSIAVLAISALILLTIMRAVGWSWNLMNLMAIPLILGTGVDYSIFMQLALRRNNGNMAAVKKSTSGALLLCGLTAIVAFASLGFSSNAGMASLGQVCALGIAVNMLLSILLLPGWWLRFALRDPQSQIERRPSRFYTSSLWKAGMTVCRILPPAWTRTMGSGAALLYGWMSPARKRIVVRNLLPVLQNDLALAEKTADKLFRRFGAKIADLLSYEAGVEIDDVIGKAIGYEQLAEAEARSRGVLLLTIHLGNWEFGSCWLVKRGVKIKVITQTEPGADFTELRQKARERRNIETIVVGNDSFAFLEVIRSLEAGSVIALLVDRPPAPTGVQVELFGHAFDTSLAAAELARATGCALVPGYIVWDGTQYEARLLPEIPYNRGALRSREKRVELCQEIMRSFEPVIKKHCDQWYHFVPVWPEEKEGIDSK